MALKLSIPKPDPEGLKRTSARLKAWWNGVEYQPGEAGEAGDEAGVVASASARVEGKSDPELSLVIACEALWGAGRLAPADPDLDVAFASALGLTKGRRLALFGPDLGARVLHCARELGIKADVFLPDARHLALAGDVVGAEKKLARDIALHGFDGAPGSVPKNRADGVLFVLACHAPEEAEVAAFTAERVLRPGGSGLMFDLFARRDDDLALDACRGPEQRRFLDEDAVISAIEAAGLEMRGQEDRGADFLNAPGQEDRGADFLNATHVAMERIKGDFEGFQAGMLQTGGTLAAAAALDQILLWRARADALRAGRLTARRILFHRPK